MTLSFDRNNLKKLSPYFDLDFSTADLEEKIIFFNNLKTVGQKSLGLAHCIQHHMAARIAVQLSGANHTIVNSSNFADIVGCYSVVKRSDELTFSDKILHGVKKWFSNIDLADFGVLQIPFGDKVNLIYFDLNKMPHTIDHSFFTPIGMELAKAGTLIVDNHLVSDLDILGFSGTQKFFQQSNFTSYCFLTNHYSLSKALFLDIKKYAENSEKYNILSIILSVFIV